MIAMESGRRRLWTAAVLCRFPTAPDGNNSNHPMIATDRAPQNANGVSLFSPVVATKELPRVSSQNTHNPELGRIIPNPARPESKKIHNGSLRVFRGALREQLQIPAPQALECAQSSGALAFRIENIRRKPTAVVPLSVSKLEIRNYELAHIHFTCARKTRNTRYIPVNQGFKVQHKPLPPATTRYTIDNQPLTVS